MAEVFALVHALQGSAGAGQAALETLGARYASSSLRAEDGWLELANMMHRDFKEPVTEYLYYGGIGADGKPCGLPPGSALPEELYRTDGAEPTRRFYSWTQVQAFTGRGALVALPGFGAGRGVQLPAADKKALLDRMTPRTVTHDGKPCPTEAVAAAVGHSGTGAWRFEVTTRKTQGPGGGRATDTYYMPPGEARPARGCACARDALVSNGEPWL